MTALSGLRVVDLTTGIAGSVAGMLYADLGAEVVKVEPPEGDPGRSEPGFAVWNRGKRSVVLDPARWDDCARLARLVAGADLLLLDSSSSVEHHPAVAKAIAGNGQLIALRLPTYEGPAPWHGGKESHGLLTAASGISMRQSSWEGGPIELVSPYMLYLHGAWAATCGLAALLRRGDRGAGQVVSVSGLQAVLMAVTNFVVVEPTAPAVNTAIGPGGPNPTYTRFRCGDGRWIFVGALLEKFQRSLLTCLGIEDILLDERIAGDPGRFLLPENRGWVKERVAAALLTDTFEVWRDKLSALGVPVGTVGEREDWLDHPQLRAVGLRVEVEDPERGTVVMPGCPIEFGASPVSELRPAPRLGEHVNAGQDWKPRPRPEDVEPLNPSDLGPLDGFRVLDPGAVVAGPYAGRLLAELGADVIKVEPASGDSFRNLGFTYNLGVRALSIDLQDPQALAAFYRLVKRSDAMVDNFRPGVLGRLKLAYDDLAAVNPDIITLSITSYGERGPLAKLPGFDPVLQAESGMMLAQGGDDEPVFNTIAINDISAAVLSALGIVVGLYHRQRGGTGQRITTSLAGSSTFLQLAELTRFPGRPSPPRGGRDYRGRAPMCRYYAVRDGWVRVDTAAEDVVPALVAMGHEPGPELADPEQADAVLASSLEQLTRDEALEVLWAIGVAATSGRDFSEVVNDRVALDSGLLNYHTTVDGRVYMATGRLARFSRTQVVGVPEPPGLGEHTTEVLSDAGLGEDEIATLVADGAVLQGEPMPVRLLANYR